MQQQRLQQQQMHQKFNQDQKPSLMKMNMFSPPHQSQHQQQNSQQYLDNAKLTPTQLLNQQMATQLQELSKLSSLMTMPSAFDPHGSNPMMSPPASQNQSQSQQSSQQQPKLKVKPGLHLLDPMAMQRRLLNNGPTDDLSEVGSTTNSMDSESPDPNSSLWHPLFGR